MKKSLAFLLCIGLSACSTFDSAVSGGSYGEDSEELKLFRMNKSDFDAYAEKYIHEMNECMAQEGFKSDDYMPGVVFADQFATDFVPSETFQGVNRIIWREVLKTRAEGDQSKRLQVEIREGGCFETVNDTMYGGPGAGQEFQDARLKLLNARKATADSGMWNDLLPKYPDCWNLPGKEVKQFSKDMEDGFYHVDGLAPHHVFMGPMHPNTEQQGPPPELTKCLDNVSFWRDLNKYHAEVLSAAIKQEPEAYKRVLKGRAYALKISGSSDDSN